jgi:hypothetical protein
MDADYGRNLDRAGAPTKAFEPSLFVWATVMSRPTEDRAIVDAGLKALAFDSGPAARLRRARRHLPPPTSAPPTSAAGSVSRAPPTASGSATRSASSPAIATRPSTSTTGMSLSAATASSNSGGSPPAALCFDPHQARTSQGTPAPDAFSATPAAVTRAQVHLPISIFTSAFGRKAAFPRRPSLNCILVSAIKRKFQQGVVREVIPIAGF